jgi:DNA-binding PadR family transcriptional regulator
MDRPDQFGKDDLHGGPPGRGRGRGHGHGGFGRGGGPGGGPGGRRKMLDVKELRILILFLMEQQPRHGYDIIREIESRTGGAYAPSPGIVYPTLSLLEDQGEISTNPSEGPRRLFVITEAGHEALRNHRGDPEKIFERLSSLNNEAEPTDYGPVGRAVGNLHAVIKRRFTGADDKQLLFDAADLIDEVSRKIERL